MKSVLSVHLKAKFEFIEYTIVFVYLTLILTMTIATRRSNPLSSPQQRAEAE